MQEKNLALPLVAAARVPANIDYIHSPLPGFGFARRKLSFEILEKSPSMVVFKKGGQNMKMTITLFAMAVLLAGCAML
ncbi:MAG: hypothetical protein ACC619_03660 [Paracoccaceae bacterium]